MCSNATEPLCILEVTKFLPTFFILDQSSTSLTNKTIKNRFHCMASNFSNDTLITDHIVGKTLGVN